MPRSLVLSVLMLLVLSAKIVPADDAPKTFPIKLAAHTVKREKLQPSIMERGAVESVHATDIVCPVKSASRGSSFATTIKRLLVQDAERVKKGQRLIELDSSVLEEELKTQRIVREQAQLKCAKAKAFLATLRSENENALDAAEASVELAKISLKQYLQAEKPATLKKMEVELAFAEERAKDAEENLKQAQTKFDQKELTAEQLKAARVSLDGARLALENARAARKIFLDFTILAQTTSLQAKIRFAEREVPRVKEAAKEKEAFARKDLEIKRSIYDREQARVGDIEEQIKHCVIEAPRDGMVVYWVPRGGVSSGSYLSVIAEGEPVRAGQTLLSMPDLSTMQVAIRIPESLAAKIEPSLAAEVKVDAFPARTFRGHVSRITATPSPRDRRVADEKAYPAVILLEGNTAGLLPGMSATVALANGNALDSVLAVPARAIVGDHAPGKSAYCLVLTSDGAEQREVTLGMRNEKMVEISSGLREGEQVVVNPRLLLDELKGRVRLAPK
jgi:HlyD family secretion protein